MCTITAYLAADFIIVSYFIVFYFNIVDIIWISLTSGVSAPPTMVMPKAELVLGISTCDTSPSNTGSRVIPEMKRKMDETTNKQIDEANIP